MAIERSENSKLLKIIERIAWSVSETFRSINKNWSKDSGEKNQKF